MNIDTFELIKRAQKVQAQIAEMEEHLEQIHVTGSAAAGLVEIDLNGKTEMSRIRIDGELFAGGDKELLEGLIVAAFSDAQEKVKEAQTRELRGLAGLPGLSGQGFPDLAGLSGLMGGAS
ncbi:MAG: YbaB/EbfC family nucleoid-associated protein [Treponema sp.]|jgi:DNA-binding YbaB/EbfC family protein|nr:YbaB/EbfC family nucleoid-associated protein [Treponema sp.]